MLTKTMLTKTIMLQACPIDLLHTEGTTWVSVKSLSDFLGLDYEKEVKSLVVNTSMSALGKEDRVLPHAKVLAGSDGKKELWIPLEHVSLYASKAEPEDLSNRNRRRACMTELPNIMANAF